MVKIRAVPRPFNPNREPTILRHMRLITDADYAEKMARSIASAPGDQVNDIFTGHETDDSCCRLEPWSVTLQRLQADVVSFGGTRLIEWPPPD